MSISVRRWPGPGPDQRRRVLRGNVGWKNEDWMRFAMLKYGPRPRWLVYHDGNNDWRVRKVEVVGQLGTTPLLSHPAFDHPVIVGPEFLFERHKEAKADAIRRNVEGLSDRIRIY